MSLLQNPSPPGRILKTLYLEPLGLSAIQLAEKLDVPRSRIERLIKGITGMTPDTAIRLSRFFGTTPQYWINLQVNYDLANAVVDVSRIDPLEMVA